MTDRPPPAAQVCPSCGGRVTLSRDGRGRRVIPFHRGDDGACPGTGTYATDQGGTP